MEEENNNKIIVDFSPGTTIKEPPQEETQEEPQPPAPPPETKPKKPRNHKLKVRLEGEPLIATMAGSPSEEQIKPKRAPPKRKQQTEPEIKETPKEEIKEPQPIKEENIKVVKLVKCDKCGKSLTAKSLKYSHKCGQDNNTIMKQPNNKIIENETGPDFQPIPEIKRIPKSTFPDYESNPRVQRMQEKREKIKTLFAHAI